MRLLVTGGCGFIGSNFINYFFDKTECLVNLDAMYYCASESNIKEDIRENKRYTFVKGSCANYDLVQNILLTHKIDHIIHFAAQSHVDNSFHQSLQYTEDNVKGTHILLEAVRTVNPSILFLHFSTDEVYGDSEPGTDAKKETHILCPTNPYSASKAAAEMYVNAYKISYGLKTIITRCNNVYGNNQYPEKLIPKFIQLLQNNRKLTIHGDGSSLRNFVHSDDVSRAVEIILQKGAVGEIYNISGDSHSELSVLQVSQYLISLLKPDDKLEDWIENVEDRPFNDTRYFIDGSKLNALGWK
jgi:dTDP-glucose 4,6-dehydratase